MLLVGNFGDGRIHAFDANNVCSLVQLRDHDGEPIVIDGLRALKSDGLLARSRPPASGAPLDTIKMDTKTLNADTRRLVIAERAFAADAIADSA